MGRETIEALSPLAAEVRAHSPDRYLATLLAAPDRRDALFALYAFDHQTARVRRVVREPMAGLVRLQWWRDAIEGAARGEAAAQPIIRGLARAFASGAIEPAPFLAVIEARQAALEAETPFDVAAFERFLSQTSGAVARAAAAALGEMEAETLAAAERAGLAAAAPALLGELRGGGDARPSWLPEEWSSADRTAAEARLIDWARARLADARLSRPSVPRQTLPALLPATLAEIRLRRPAGGEGKPIASAPIRLLWRWVRRRY